MRANTFVSINNVQVRDVPEPTLLNAQDAIVRVTSTAICGSDLHLVDGYVPAVQPGDILGHEFMGEIVEVGRDVGRVAVGDRVVVAFPISCGRCWSCRQGLYSVCENGNPNAWLAEKLWGYSPAGIYGYSHILGGFAGGQAEYVRVPFADVGAFKVPADLPDEKLLFLSDIFPTGYMGAEQAGIEPGDVVAVWGAGPVGQFAAASAFLLGAGRVIVVDRFEDRLEMARTRVRAETIDYEREDVHATLKEMTGGRGPDRCIDAVGMEAHGPGLPYAFDRVMQATRMQSDRPTALREAILACRNGGTVSIIGGYGGFIDKFPIGAVMNRSLTIRTGQAHVQRYMAPLLERILGDEIDPSFVITHRLPLEEAAHGFDLFKHKRDGCVKVVLKPGGPPPVQ